MGFNSAFKGLNKVTPTRNKTSPMKKFHDLSRRAAWGRSPAEILGSNPTGGMDICLLWVSCVVRYRSLRRADHLSRGVLPTVLRRCVWSRNIKNRCSIYIYIYDISSLRVKGALLIRYTLLRLSTQSTGCPKFIHSQHEDRHPRSDENNGNSVSGTNAKYALKFLILQNKIS